MKRILAFLLVMVSLLTLASCSKAEYALKAGDTVICGEMFYSELYSYKNEFLINYLGLTEDNAAIWSQDSPSGNNETVGETITRMALEEMVQFAWVIEYARDNGAVLGEEDYEAIDTIIEEMRGNFDTEEEFLAYLESLKFDEESMRDYVEFTALYDKGFNMLVAENGLYAVPQEKYDEFYKNNFYTVKHIYINTVSGVDEEGNAVSLTDDEKKAKKDKIDKLMSDLESGVDFDTLYLISEDSMASYYPDGLTFSDGMIFEEYEETAKSLKAGEYEKIELENGGVYIILRLELSETDREEYNSYIKGTVNADVQMNIYEDHCDEVEINYDIINSYKIEDVPIVSR